MRKLIAYVFLITVEILFLSSLISSNDEIEIDYSTLISTFYSGKKTNKVVYNNSNIEYETLEDYLTFKSIKDEHPFNHLLNLSLNSTFEELLRKEAQEYNNFIIAKETKTESYIDFRIKANNDSLIAFLEDKMKQNVIENNKYLTYDDIYVFFKEKLISREQLNLIYEFLLKLKAEQPLRKEIIKVKIG